MFQGSTNQTADTREISHYDRLTDELKTLVDARPVFDREEAAAALDVHDIVGEDAMTAERAREIVEYYVPGQPAPTDFPAPDWVRDLDEWQWSGGEWMRRGRGEVVTTDDFEVVADLYQSDGFGRRWSDVTVTLDLNLRSPVECRALADALMRVAETFAPEG
ncbi:MAG TPA: hypothetical protein VNR17_10170 [Luteimicrobium sp.]|nr:hypothetical protein [Luteimicrobium sp.]